MIGEMNDIIPKLIDNLKCRASPYESSPLLVQATNNGVMNDTNRTQCLGTMIV
jgi:hypothetical protein